MTHEELVQDMHKEHKDWADEITYWHNELVYFNNVVLGLIQKTDDPQEVSRMEEFKSKFDNMLQGLNEVRDNIAAHEKSLNFEPGTDGSTQMNQAHEQMRWKVEGFYKDFRDLKNDFYKFADKDCKY